MTWVAAISLVVLVVLVLFVIPFSVHAQVPSITLDWTATGDDGSVGTATSYQMRWSAARPDTATTATMDTWWNAATIVTGLPVPKISGSAESFSVPGPFTTGGTYYFVLKACDEVPNCSSYSNVAAKFLPDVTPPQRIFDLRAR